jgi:hypothetical protein
MWLLLVFALTRCGKAVPWPVIVPMIVLQAGGYTQLNLSGLVVLV